MAGGARYWIDGYNVLLRLKVGGEATLEERRAELIARVAATGLNAWIAFDSREPVHDARLSLPRRVQVAFAPPGRSADALIIEHVRNAPDLNGVVIVSDDREVASRCAFLGARTMATAEFGRMLKPATPKTPQKERPLSRSEVKDWMQWFGYPAENDAASSDAAAQESSKIPPPALRPSKRPKKERP